MTTLDRPEVVTSGWVAFAAVIAGVAGVFNLLYGIVVLFNDDWVAFSTGGILVFNLASWGWILLALGAIQVFISAGIAVGKPWARVIGVLWASVIAVGQMAFLNVYPLWSLVIITTSFIIVYGLTVHGDEV